jgi:hypothetical protein
MPKPIDPPFVLEIRLFGLPHGTDGAALAQKALGLASELEELGCFDQRELEPAHRFTLNGEEDR